MAHMYKLATTNQMPQCSPQLGHLLYCVATGKPAMKLMESGRTRMDDDDDDDESRQEYIC